MFKKSLIVTSILLFSFYADAASTIKLKQAKISGNIIKIGQGADIVQSRIEANKYIAGQYGESSKGYYVDNGITYIITFGPPSSGGSVYVVKKIERILK